MNLKNLVKTIDEKKPRPDGISKLRRREPDEKGEKETHESHRNQNVS